MRFLGLIAALLVGFGSHSRAQDAPPPAPDPAPISPQLGLANEPDGRLTVTIGDAGPYQFIVDTGAQATVLSRELAGSLGLFDRQPVTLIGVASRVETETVAIESLSIGQLQAKLERAPLVDSQHLAGADGILGIDALQGQRILLDFVRQEMSIANSQESRPAAGYEIVVRARPHLGQLIVTDARIQGIRTTVVIDTGAEASVGNAALARRLRNQSREMAHLYDVNGAVAQGSFHIAEIARIGPMNLLKLPILFAPSPAFEALGLEDRPTLILGMRELRVFQRIVIDFPSRRILFDLPAGAEGADF